MNPAPTKSPTLLPLVYFATGIFGLILSLPGCTGNTEEHDHIVYYHKPTGFNQAVVRLDEIHNVMIGNEPLPGPRQFEDTSHDHHHDDDSEDHEHDHEHEHEMVEINIFQEWYDIVRWLPTIAGETDLPKKHWDEVNGLSNDLGKLVAKIQSAGKSGDQNLLRKSYIESGNAIGRIIQALKDMIPVHDDWDKKIMRWQWLPNGPHRQMPDRTLGELRHA